MAIDTRVNNERGVASLEFLLILPLLLFVLFAGAELSRAWFTLNLLTTAAREAARSAVVAAPDAVQSAASAKLNQMLGAGNWTGSTTCVPSPCATDSQVQVAVSMTFQTALPVLLPMLSSIPLQQTAVMRYE